MEKLRLLSNVYPLVHGQHYLFVNVRFQLFSSIEFLFFDIVVYEAERNVRCNYPIYIKNGFIALYNVTIWEDQTYTGRIIYECNYGYETFDGNDRIESECLNGTWTYVTDCQGEWNILEKKIKKKLFCLEIPTCPKQDLLDIEAKVENSYVHNGKIPKRK